jgi:hypothetical protein
MPQTITASNGIREPTLLSPGLVDDGVQDLGDSEIQHLGFALGVGQDVGRLDSR